MGLTLNSIPNFPAEINGKASQIDWISGPGQPGIHPPAPPAGVGLIDDHIQTNGQVAESRPPKPPSAQVGPEAAARIPDELKRLDRWVVWRWVWRPDKNKGQGGWNKPPVHPQTGRPTDATDESAWMTFDEAREAALRLGDGIGFALGKNSPITGVDLDHVIDDQGRLDPKAQTVVDRLNSYTEVTPSKTGLRIWIKGHLPRNQKGKPRCRTSKHPGIEFYDSDRYFTVTGHHRPGTPTTIEDRTEALAALHAELFPPAKGPARKAVSKPVKPSAGLADETPDEWDDAILDRARRARNGAAFDALYRGDTSAYNSDDSAADLALCSHLAFWTDGDVEAIDRLFRRSGLYREKWDRADYRERTIAKALEGRTEFYDPSPKSRRDGTVASSVNGKTIDGQEEGRTLHPESDRLKRTEGVEEAKDDPHRLARTFVNECHQHADHPTLIRYLDDFYEYRDHRHEMMPDSAAEGRLTAAIKREFDRLYLEEIVDYEAEMEEFVRRAADRAEGDKRPAMPKRPVARKVAGGIYGDSMRALRSMVGVPHTLTMPCWLRQIEGAPAPRDILPTQDGLVDLSSLVIEEDHTTDLDKIKVYESTPAFFSTCVLNYSFDPSTGAEPARWLQFLNEVFPDDEPTQRELQKWFGYLISMDTSYQKMLYLIGKPRSGKGTIARVMTELVGHHNITSPTLMDLAETFGLSDCVGKTLMLISDARIGGDDKDLARLQERLLKISGEDPLQINRKHRALFSTKLATRIVIISNEVPGFRDSSGAFKSRMRPLRFLQTFEGKEDPDLFEKKLKPEMPGILNWAIVGRAMLKHDGGFFVPESAQGLVTTLAEAATPLLLFLADCCVTTDPQATVKKEDIYLVYRWWCGRTGNALKPIQTFGKLLKAAHPEVDETRLRDEDTRPRGYRGLRLQTEVWTKVEEAERLKETARSRF